MKRSRVLVAAVLLAILFPAGQARAQAAVPDSGYYELSSSTSEFEWGCFGPCECPILVQSPLTGSFILRESHTDPLYTYYDVLDVQWKYARQTGEGTIRGSGFYRRGGEVAQMEQMTLALSFDGAPSQKFDSGLKPTIAGFPSIAARLSLHGEYCRDSVLVIDAKSTRIVGTPERPAAETMMVGPNPFRLSARIALALPRDGTMDLAVFDIAGHRARTLVHHEWMRAGSYAWAWDGKLESGASAPPGIYLVRLESATGRLSRTLAKLD